MHRIRRVISIAALAAFLGLSASALLAPGPGLAQKFENKDTAADRKDNTFGTRKKDDSADITTGRDERGDEVMGTTPREYEERDWYDNVIINVDADWQRGNGTRSSTTTVTDTNSSGDVTGGQETETIQQLW